MKIKEHRRNRKLKKIEKPQSYHDRWIHWSIQTNFLFVWFCFSFVWFPSKWTVIDIIWIENRYYRNSGRMLKSDLAAHHVLFSNARNDGSLTVNSHLVLAKIASCFIFFSTEFHTIKYFNRTLFNVIETISVFSIRGAVEWILSVFVFFILIVFIPSIVERLKPKIKLDVELSNCIYLPKKKKRNDV